MTPTPRATVLLTDGDERAALAATRNLVAAGYRVYVAARGRTSLAGVSRGALPLVVRSDPLEAPRSFAGEIGAAAAHVGADVILPITDASVGAMLASRDLLPPGAALPFPTLEQFLCASDKTSMAALAASCGLGVPAGAVIRSPSDMQPIDAFARYPAFLKPRTSVVTLRDGTRRKLAVEPVRDAAACRRVVAALAPDAFPALLQERVRGPGEGMFLLRWNGRIVARFAHRRLREKPPWGGVSVYRESIAVPPALERASVALLDRLDWQGVAMVECKREESTGRHVFMELNGRLWGSLQLAVDAGVPFPALLAACALGTPPAPASDYRAGVRLRWLWGDVDHLYTRLRRPPTAAAADDRAPSRLRTVMSVLTQRPGRDRLELERWRDPAPALLETARRLHVLRRP